MTLYDRVAATPDGSRALAAARLRREVLRCLHRAQAASGLSVADIATAIGGRRRDVRRALDGDGNLRPDVVARYLHAMGYEVELRIVPAGEPRRKVVEGGDYGAAVSAPLTDAEAAALRQDLADGTVPRRTATVLSGERDPRRVQGHVTHAGRADAAISTPDEELSALIAVNQADDEPAEPNARIQAAAEQMRQERIAAGFAIARALGTPEGRALAAGHPDGTAITIESSLGRKLATIGAVDGTPRP